MAEGRIISIFEVRGGSIIGTNLAVAISGQTKLPVAMVDLDADGNNKVATLLNLNSSKTIKDILPAIDHLDGVLLRGLMSKHPSGVHLFPGAGSDSDLDAFSRSHIEKICSMLRAAYSFTIIEAGEVINERVLRIFDQSDLVFFITVPQLLSLNRLKKFFERLKTFHFSMNMMKVLVNMSNIKAGLTKSHIESFLSNQVFAEIPYDPTTVLQSINEGKPIILLAPSSDVSFAIKTLAQTILKEQDIYLKENKGIFASSIENREERKKFRSDQPLELEPVPSAAEGLTTYATELDKKIVEIKIKIHKKLIEELDKIDLKGTQDPARQAEVRQATQKKIEQLLSEMGEIQSREIRSKIVAELLDEVLGLGALERFLKDESVSEIMVNGKDSIYIERAGKIYKTDSRFTSDTQLMTVIDRILAPIGRRVDEATPLVDARTADGSRVNVVIPPLSLIGPTITIRKFVTKRLGMEDLIGRLGSLTREMSDFLRICVLLKKNVIVSGGTGSGKTTLLNMLSSFIPADERIVTIENSAELKLLQEHVVGLEARPPSLEGTGEITIRRMVINALRMRPDRIVVGECRGGEALDMLQAMNTGHDGSLTTIHANSPKDAIARLITMVIMAGTELPEKAIREQILGAVHLFVHISRYSDGTRKVSYITELQGEENGAIKLVDIFRFVQTGVDENRKVVGKFVPTGVLPSFFPEIAVRGLKLDQEIFKVRELPSPSSAPSPPKPQLTPAHSPL